MSEASIALIITSFFTFAASVLAAWVAYKSKQSADMAHEAAQKAVVVGSEANESAKKAVEVSTEVSTKTDVLAENVDGRLSQLLRTISIEREQAGHAKGVADEQGRVAEQLRAAKTD